MYLEVLQAMELMNVPDAAVQCVAGDGSGTISVRAEQQELSRLLSHVYKMHTFHI